MAKTRFSISLDEVEAAAIKQAAARTGVDVSAYMGRAAMYAVKRAQLTEDIFRDIDERVAAQEEQDSRIDFGAFAHSSSDAVLSEEEQSVVEQRWDAFFGSPQAESE
jgi:hypothetical protein